MTTLATMRVPVDLRVQPLCPILADFRRNKRPFKPFSSPQAVTQERVRHTDNSSSAVLGTADSRYTTNVRPLQEQLRDQMDLHKLQREPVPEDTSDGESVPAKNVNKDRTLNSKDGTKDKQADKQAPPRKRDTSRRRNKQRSATQSDQPKTVAKKAARAARSGRVQFNGQQPEEQAPEPKHQRTLTKQEDVALCSAIQDFAFIEQQRQLVFGSPTRGSWSTTNHKVETQEDAPIKGEDYQKLKSWKDAVGAPTFSQLHARCTSGERAKTMLLHYNKGLVQHFVWRCKRMGTSCGVGELVLAGEEALYKAAIKWDPTKGTRFSTFAFQRVNRAIVGYLMEHEDVIKLPVNLKELQGKIKGAQARLSQSTGRAPTPNEIAQHLEQPLTRVLLCMRKVQQPINLDAQSGDAERDSLVDQLAASIDEDSADNALGLFTHTQFASDIEGVLEMLPHREGEVLALRYGLFNGEPLSLADVAKILKMSAEGVRKNELQAFRRLRQAGRLQPLMEYLRNTDMHGNDPNASM